ncbi:kinase-like protein [Auricularia subglabra TFB-10046 SS5]|nr:kinase-like protein [Auricularia subglabra TFB-10046 SS5]
MAQRDSILNSRGRQLLPLEVSAWQVLDHPRILPFYGISAQFGLQQVALVSPLAPNGNMKDFILRNPTKDRLRLVKQVAEGLEYLHVNAGIVHGGLKCANVLISADECALVGDFGLSTLFERAGNTSASMRSRNMAPFAAPELFSDRALRRATQDAPAGGTSLKTMQSDVFAFGCLIYEAYSCAEPLRTAPNDEIPPRNVGTALAIPLNDRLWELCLGCWARDPLKRPNCSEILVSLDHGVSGGIIHCVREETCSVAASPGE